MINAPGSMLPAIALLVAALLGTTPAVAQQTPAPPAGVVISFDATGAEQTRVVQGLADRRTGRRFSADDPLRVASISKLVVALGVMRLVEARRVDLDADVSRYLGWRLRHPAHPDQPITLAMLLGHRSGLADGIDYILPLDGDLETALASPAAWDNNRRPGGAFAYANINYPVIAAAMEGATGERFDLLMQRLVFRPLNLEACFNWTTCSDHAVARAAVLYRPNGDVAKDDVQGQRPTCPVTPASDGSCDLARYRLARNGSSFSPQGGLRISARGLARIGEMLLRGGDRFLRPRSIRRLMDVQPVTALSGPSVGEGGEGSFFCRYGLGMHQLAMNRPGCRDDPIGDGRPRIGHSGDAYSLRAGLFFDVERGDGMVWITTENPEHDAPRGSRSSFTQAEESLITAAGLPDPPPRRRR